MLALWLALSERAAFNQVPDLTQTLQHGIQPFEQRRSATRGEQRQWAQVCVRTLNRVRLTCRIFALRTVIPRILPTSSACTSPDSALLAAQSSRAFDSASLDAPHVPAAFCARTCAASACMSSISSSVTSTPDRSNSPRTFSAGTARGVRRAAGGGAGSTRASMVAASGAVHLRLVGKETRLRNATQGRNTKSDIAINSEPYFTAAAHDL